MQNNFVETRGEIFKGKSLPPPGLVSAEGHSFPVTSGPRASCSQGEEGKTSLGEPIYNQGPGSQVDLADHSGSRSRKIDSRVNTSLHSEKAGPGSKEL